MDSRLNERLQKWHEAIGVLCAAERVFLTLEANEKPMFASLFLSAEGKTVVERESRAYSSPEWREFQEGLVEAKVEYNKEKRLLELKQSAFQSEYICFKLESEAVQKMPRSLT